MCIRWPFTFISMYFKILSGFSGIPDEFCRCMDKTGQLDNLNSVFEGVKNYKQERSF